MGTQGRHTYRYSHTYESYCNRCTGDSFFPHHCDLCKTLACIPRTWSDWMLNSALPNNLLYIRSHKLMSDIQENTVITFNILSMSSCTNTRRSVSVSCSREAEKKACIQILHLIPLITIGLTSSSVVL